MSKEVRGNFESRKSKAQNKERIAIDIQVVDLEKVRGLQIIHVSKWWI